MFTLGACVIMQESVSEIHSKLGNAVISNISTQDMENNLVYNSSTSCKSLSKLMDDVRLIIMRSLKKVMFSRSCTHVISS